MNEEGISIRFKRDPKTWYPGERQTWSSAFHKVDTAWQTIAMFNEAMPGMPRRPGRKSLVLSEEHFDLLKSWLDIEGNEDNKIALRAWLREIGYEPEEWM